MLLMGKSTLSMAIFNSYVSSPEGTSHYGMPRPYSIALRSTTGGLFTRWTSARTAGFVNAKELIHFCSTELNLTVIGLLFDCDFTILN